jgi:hypothetical protein
MHAVVHVAMHAIVHAAPVATIAVVYDRSVLGPCCLHQLQSTTAPISTPGLVCWIVGDITCARRPQRSVALVRLSSALSFGVQLLLRSAPSQLSAKFVGFCSHSSVVGLVIVVAIVIVCMHLLLLLVTVVIVIAVIVSPSFLFLPFSGGIIFIFMPFQNQPPSPAQTQAQTQNKNKNKCARTASDTLMLPPQGL